MKKPVYITRDSDDNLAEIWDAEIGIMKVKGCAQYISGSSFNPTKCGHKVKGRISRNVTEKECIRKYGSFPLPGEAYLVTEKENYFDWLQVDHTMLFVNYHTGNVLEEQ